MFKNAPPPKPKRVIGDTPDEDIEKKRLKVEPKLSSLDKFKYTKTITSFNDGEAKVQSERPLKTNNSFSITNTDNHIKV
jgi:hypothetical protein